MRQHVLLSLFAGATAVHAVQETPADSIFAPPAINIELVCEAQPPVVITIAALPTEDVAVGTGVAIVNGGSNGGPAVVLSSSILLKLYHPEQVQEEVQFRRADQAPTPRVSEPSVIYLTANRVAVVLEHSVFIQNVICVNPGLQLSFSTVEFAAFA
ncbi:hypothetical protein K490DRAFT_60297 [Saccharata proteae CBS 121410]|uniref:Uncharacterized protein n=1 Tax=Saccharata proteae CBS 121410 TaxID=1314787 RepID=A0A9P4HL78_9PEZI|nr:hypothetical protein K490DRAFT_60297 [Saccharata proteae CBS 121410]